MFYALCRKQVSAVFAIKFCRGDENSFKTPSIRRRRMARLRLCVPGLNYCRKRAFRKLQIAKVNKFRNKTSTIFSGNRVGVLFYTSLFVKSLFGTLRVDYSTSIGLCQVFSGKKLHLWTFFFIIGLRLIQR